MGFGVAGQDGDAVGRFMDVYDSVDRSAGENAGQQHFAHCSARQVQESLAAVRIDAGGLEVQGSFDRSGQREMHLVSHAGDNSPLGFGVEVHLSPRMLELFELLRGAVGQFVQDDDGAALAVVGIDNHYYVADESGVFTTCVPGATCDPAVVFGAL